MSDTDSNSSYNVSPFSSPEWMERRRGRTHVHRMGTSATVQDRRRTSKPRSRSRRRGKSSENEPEFDSFSFASSPQLSRANGSMSLSSPHRSKQESPTSFSHVGGNSAGAYDDNHQRQSVEGNRHPRRHRNKYKSSVTNRTASDLKLSASDLNDVRQLSEGSTYSVGGIESRIRAILQDAHNEHEQVVEQLIEGLEAEKREALASVKSKYRKEWKGTLKILEEEIAAIDDSHVLERAALEERLERSITEASAARDELRALRDTANLREELADRNVALERELRCLRDNLGERQSMTNELKHTRLTAAKQLAQVKELHREEMQQHLQEIERMRDALVKSTSSSDQRVADLEEGLRKALLAKSKVEICLDEDIRDLQATVGKLKSPKCGWERSKETGHRGHNGRQEHDYHARLDDSKPRSRYDSSHTWESGRSCHSEGFGIERGDRLYVDIGGKPKSGIRDRTIRHHMSPYPEERVDLEGERFARSFSDSDDDPSRSSPDQGYRLKALLHSSF